MVFSLESVNKCCQEMVLHWAFDVPIKLCWPAGLMFALTPFVPIKNVIFEKNPDSKERDFDTMESRTKTGILNAMKIDYFQGC